MSRDWDRLARAVDDARYVCGLDTLAAFVRATGITEKTARKLLAAEPVAPKTRRMVERALGWP